MDDVISRELKCVVEQAVRPVRATMTRKRRMREELLAHLVATFDQEAERLADEQAAIHEALRRFGEPRELTTQLQQAVPRWDRYWSVLENMGYRPNESAWHLAARYFLVMLPVYTFWLPIWMLAHGTARIPEPAEAQRIWALAAIGAVLWVSLANLIPALVVAPLLHKIGPFVAARRHGRILLAVLCGISALCGLLLPGFAGLAVLFILMAHQAVRDWHYQADWA